MSLIITEKGSVVTDRWSVTKAQLLGTILYTIIQLHFNPVVRQQHMLRHMGMVSRMLGRATGHTNEWTIDRAQSGDIEWAYLTVAVTATAYRGAAIIDPMLLILLRTSANRCTVTTLKGTS